MAIYDLTTFTEINDGSNLWTQTTTRNATTGWVGKSNAMVLYKDMGVDAIEDYEYYVDIDITTGSNYALVGIWAVVNSPSFIVGMGGQPGQRLQMSYANGTYSLTFYDNASYAQDFYSGLSLNTVYYLKIVKTGSSGVCKIYPTALDRINDTNVIDTLSVTCGTTKLRYLQAGMGAGLGGGGAFQGYFENFEAPVPLLTLDETVTISDEVILSSVSQISQDGFSVSDDFESYVIQFDDISNKINTSALILKNINNKINNVIRVISNFANLFSSTNGQVSDFNNDVRTLAETTNNINNDIRTLADWQVPGDAGFESLGKEYIKVYIASVEQTDVTVDSISITKVLNGTHTASFELGRAYDNTKPAIESSVEIKYNNWVLYKGYITEITPASSPEAIIINCKDDYWKNNRTKKYFFVGHKPRDNKEKYYNRISTALSNEYSWSPGIGSFVPQTLSSFGTGYSDTLTSLITNAGNFAWYYDVEGNKKLWTAGQGDIINLERQTIGTNLSLYQVITHQFKESISNIVNKLRVQMGNKVIRKFNPTGATKDYQSSSYIIAQVSLVPAWEEQYEILAKDSENGYGWDWRDPDKDADFKKVFTKYNLPFLDPDKAKWTDRFPLRIEIIKPLAFGSWELSVPEGSLTEGFTVDYENQELVFNEPIYLIKKDSSGRVDEIRVPNITLWINKEIYNSNTEDESDDPESDVSNEFMFFTDKMGTYPITIMGSLRLSNFSIQRGYTYINWEDENWWETKVVVPSWNDTNFARDYANWQLSKTADKKITGIIEVTLDTACVYNIQLNNRIMIDGVIEDSLNIQSISYNIGSFRASIQLENGRYYRRNVSLSSHGE